MSIQFYEHINHQEHNRLELLVDNFNYYDGIDLLSRIFTDCFGDQVVEIIDGFFYKIIRMEDKNGEYVLNWHEDVGTYLFCKNHDIEILKSKLKVVLNLLVRK